MSPHSAFQGNARRFLLRPGAILLTLLPLLMLGTRVQAQTVDYGGLEQLFGEPVTTSATGQPQRATEVPAPMEIVTAGQIRRSGAVDVPGVLKQVHGVDVLQWGTDDADVSVRGYNQAFSPRLLVLVDGRQVYNDQYGYTPWTAVPVELSAIRQIEVVKGPNTALFGANAVSGVINIITYNPLYDDVNNISVTGGTQGTIRGSAVTTIQDKGVWAVRISGSAGLSNDFTTPIPASFMGARRFQNSRGAVDVDGVVQLAPMLQAGLEFSHAETFSNDVDPSYALSRDRHSATSVKGQVNAETGFGLVQFLGYTNWITEYAPGPIGNFDFNDQSTVLQLQDVLRLGADHVVRAALEFRHNEMKTTPVSGGRVFYDTPSFSGMWNWTISSALSWTNAVRFDSLFLGRSGSAPLGYPFPNSAWNRTISQWSFNSGLVWKANDDDTVRLLVSRGIELPSLAGFGSVLINTPLFDSSGDPRTRASAVMNYEADWDHSIAAMNGRLRTAFFLQKTTDAVSLLAGVVPGPPTYTLTGNVGSSDAVGGEISLDGRFSESWNWGLSYRWETIKDKFIPFAANGLAYTDFEHTTPKHQAKANLGWARDGWEADISAYYQSATQGLIATLTGTNLQPVPDYFNADARIGYRINDNLTLSLSGQNLLTASQKQTSGPAIQRRLFLNLSTSF
jgi:outer membrane receptor for ferrienterochelin and colicins